MNPPEEIVYKYNTWLLLSNVAVVFLIISVARFLPGLLNLNDIVSIILLGIVELSAIYWIWSIFKHSYFIIIGAPAIKITAEYLFIQEKGFKICWRDIESIDMIRPTAGTIGLKSMQITLRDTWHDRGSLKNPVLKIYYWLLAHSISITYATIKGDTNEMYDTVRRYYFNNRDN